MVSWSSFSEQWAKFKVSTYKKNSKLHLIKTGRVCQILAFPFSVCVATYGLYILQY